MSATSVVNRKEDQSLELTITIPWLEVKQSYDQAVDKAVGEAEIEGFRKGKAPRELVEGKLNKTKIYEEVLRQLLPTVYNEVITTNNLKPIITPKVELKEGNEGKDWVLRMLTCERPGVTLGNYRQAVSYLKKSKQTQLWTPGTEPKKEEEKDSKPTVEELLKAIYDNVTANLPALLIDHEVNRLLSDLIDQVRKLGLTVDQYLASSGRTSDTLRHEYEEQAKRTLTLEFALEEIADKEGVLISDDDITAVIKTAKTEQEQKIMEGQRYYLASVLRRQKTLDFLAALP